MVISLIWLIIGFVLLIKGADYLVDGSSAFAKKASVREIVIGLTIVAFGTSAPELVVNVFASFQNKTNVAFGNIIGSNIVNVLLILGIAAIIRPIHTERNTVWREIPFSLMATLVLIIICNDQLFNGASSYLSRGDGFILLLFFIIFLIYTFGLMRTEGKESPEIKQLSVLKITIYIIAGLVALFIGGKLVVDNAIQIAQYFAVSEKLIGLTIVSIGTSLPELFTSATAAAKGKSEIAIGNIVGSNIFNILFVLGISSIIRPLPFDTTLNLDFAFLTVASILLFITMFTGKQRRLDRWEAIIFICIYVIYIVILMIRK
jgi:cation:H+ antiporter